MVFAHRRNRFMSNRIGRSLLAVLLAAATAGLSLFAAAQDVPQQLRPPAEEQLLVQVHAKGEQVYVCNSDASHFAWTLKGPEAQLLDKNGKPIGKQIPAPHSAGGEGGPDVL